MSAYQPVVGDLLDINVEKASNITALIDPEKDISLTWSEWRDQVLRLANALIALGVKPGDRVAAFLKDAIEIPTSLLAILKIGCVFVPLNYRLAPEELRYVLDDCAVKVLIFDKEGQGIIQKIRNKVKTVAHYICTATNEFEDVISFQKIFRTHGTIEIERSISENDVAMIMYTSGTTGNPKGTVHTHKGVIAAADAWTRPAGITPMDRSIALGPLYHIGPLLSNFMPTLIMGGSNVIQKHFDPGVTLRWIKKYAITVMWATPTHLNMLVSCDDVKKYEKGQLRTIQYSGAPLSTGLFYKIRDIFGKVDFVNAYGMTELDAVSAIYPEEHDSHLGSVGRALPKTFIRIVEPDKGDPELEVEKGMVGEIIVRSPCMMKEYWGLPEKTKAVIKGEWYFTGDLGRMDEDGYLFYMEREDNMIISGGENIYPLEIENILSKHEKIKNVAVVGTPHEKWGEIVTAVVVKADETLTKQEIDEYCLQSDDLARYKRPKRYLFVRELPTTSSGKVNKKMIQARLADNS